MNVFSIVPYPVLPLTHGGRVRAYRLAVGLARAGANVELCCPWRPGLPLRPFLREGIRISPFVFASNVLPALLGDKLVPPLFQLSIQPFTRGPRTLLRRADRFDVVEFHFCAYAPWMKRLTRVTSVVYSAHNVELDYTMAQSNSWVWRASGRRVGVLERQAVQTSDLVVTCTEADARRLNQLYGQAHDLAIVPNGFDPSDLPPSDGLGREEARTMLGLMPEELAILFVGGPADHNRRAVRFLEHQLLPRLQRPARLLLAGQCAPPRREGRVVSLGRVDRLAPLLAAADVAVNPVQSGSGSNVKVAEYLAAGLPIVTTPVGLRGYEAFSHRVTVVELDRFAEAVLGQQRRAGHGTELGELSWDTLGRRLHDIYENLVRRRKVARAQ